MTQPFLVPARFNGPPGCGNGGYVSGLLAAHLDQAAEPVEVTLQRPVPLDVPLEVTSYDGEHVLSDAAGPVARARTEAKVIDPIEPVSLAEATEAVNRFDGFVHHPFPTCFACGVDRTDGLRIFPGEVTPTADGAARLAAPWTPDPGQGDPQAVTWAALDCIGGWAGDLEDRYLLLGRMTGVIDTLPRAGEPHVVLGQQLGTEGRKTTTAATLVDADGRVVARARHTWIEISREVFLQLGR